MDVQLDWQVSDENGQWETIAQIGKDGAATEQVGWKEVVPRPVSAV